MSLMDRAKELVAKVKQQLTGDRAKDATGRAVQGAHRAKDRITDVVQDARSRLRRT